ncbi:transcriptional regulator PhoU [Clostridium tepidiprofundi DSM 19306]|uniref:Transcriptional regulator PhoU n=1 Tax=Clostridium tepidiprofundi DSM 19306 TaxID=1121338 RepID=A0A151B5L5_9CLOT|nr:Na/Pi cotransporter family protein [Clostridium tepidiprofundi]KYH35214.1 transcriptional regulator PhoU [Clostridium tepidiprofundi DSM 19306]
MKIVQMIVALFGGLGLFLYGMKMMGDGLENAAGEKLKSIFKKITSNPIKGVITGALATAIIQSSSATTVMVVGFVNARLMDLFQAAAVIMGANIGTTITAQMITLDVEALIPVFLGIGALIVLFTKRKNIKEIGNIVLGFGILFLGMHLMKDAMNPLRSSQAFTNLLSTLEGNIPLGILAGLAITAIVQSSSATTSMLIALAATGILNLHTAVPIILGCNIGTCVTALISSVGTSKNAKRAAVIHLMFNIIGALVFIPLIMFTPVVDWIASSSNLPKRQIANFHTFFNVVNTVVFIPFIKVFVNVVNKLIPGEDERDEYGVKYIDERLLETPVIAVGQARQEVLRMTRLARDNYDLAIKAFKENDNNIIEQVYKNEKLINLLEDEITKFLVELSKSELLENQTEIVTSMFHVVNDAERIGDHAENIVDLTSEKIQKKLQFSKEAMEELEGMYKYTLNAVDMSIEAFNTRDKNKVKEVKAIEERIDVLEKELRASHIRRLNQGICNATVGAVFLDIISNLERIGDHAMNIAESIYNE